MVQKKKGPRIPIAALPPPKGKKFGEPPGEFSRWEFGPYPPKTKMRSVSAFDAKNLRGYLCEGEKGALHSNSRFKRSMGSVRKEAQSETQNAYALIEIGDMILESEHVPYLKWVLCKSLMKNLFLIEELDFKTAAAFLVRVDRLELESSLTKELMANPREYLGDVRTFKRMLKYLATSLAHGREDGEFAKDWCGKLNLNAEILREIIDESGRGEENGVEA